MIVEDEDGDEFARTQDEEHYTITDPYNYLTQVNLYEGTGAKGTADKIIQYFPPRQGGGYLIPPLGNQGRGCFRSHVAKSYFETYKSYDHVQNFRPLSQKFSEISRFEKFEFLRFCLTLTHRNCHNSLNF